MATKKKMEVKKGKVKELLDITEDISISAKFSISEIKMKSDWRWKVKMLVHAILPDTHHDYSIKLVFNETPFTNTLDRLEKDIDELCNHPTMFPDMDKKTIKELDSRIKKTKEDMNKLKAECYEIEFVTQSEEIKYKDGDTSLLFRVLDTVIEPLNDQKYRLTNYRAVLTPVYKK